MLLIWHMEQERINLIPPDMLELFFQQILPIRWVDDAFYVLLERLTPEVAAVFADLTREGFYGGGLRLLKQEGNEAFGFMFKVENGQIRVRQSAEYIEKFDDLCFEKQWSNVQGNGTFQSERVSVGVTSGYFARLLDMTNEAAPNTKAQLVRLIWEMRSVGIPSDTIRRGYAKIKQQMWQNLEGLEKHMWVARTVARACAMGADATALVLDKVVL